jgi:5-carboxymethyl-2-hydroxymuconic-semialdehyde dehydrogenase
MELGGKSPFVIFDDADLRARARRRGLHDLQQQRRALHRRQPHPGAAPASTPTSSPTSPPAPRASPWATRWTRHDRRPDDLQGHLAKVRSYIELGPQEGATLLCGGLDRPVRCRRWRRSAANGNFVWPTVFADVDNRMRIAQEEIFGPVACLIPFNDEAEAVSIANDTIRPEQLRLDREHRPRHRVAAAIEAGMCFVNSQNVRDLRQPFGGTKASGTGREGGTWSYEVFLEPKNVCVSLWGRPPHPALGRLSAHAARPRRVQALC